MRLPAYVLVATLLVASALRAASTAGDAPVPALASGADTPTTPPLRLDRIDEAEPGDRLPPGWEVREVGGVPVPRSVVVNLDGARALRFTARGEAAWFWRELESPLEADGGRLRWRWRVDEGVEGAALADPERDDAPARLFVVFGRGGLLSTPRTIFYSWGGEEAVGTAMRSWVGDRIGVAVVRNAGSPRGAWLEEERDVAADYRTVFGDEPGAVTAVGFMIDTDQTRERARSWLAWVEWRPR